MKMKTIPIKPLVVLKGNKSSRCVYESDLEKAEIGDTFSAVNYKDDDFSSFEYEEVLEFVGYDEEGYYATLMTYDKGTQTKEFIYFEIERGS